MTYDQSASPVDRSSAYTLPFRDPTYTTPFATVGEELTNPPVAKDQSSAPVAAFSAYRLPSRDPTYTTPFATAGEELMVLPVG